MGERPSYPVKIHNADITHSKYPQPREPMRTTRLYRKFDRTVVQRSPPLPWLALLRSLPSCPIVAQQQTGYWARSSTRL